MTPQAATHPHWGTECHLCHPGAWSLLETMSLWTCPTPANLIWALHAEAVPMTFTAFLSLTMVSGTWPHREEATVPARCAQADSSADAVPGAKAAGMPLEVGGLQSPGSTAGWWQCWVALVSQPVTTPTHTSWGAGVSEVTGKTQS